jgi:hypothetical protein
MPTLFQVFGFPCLAHPVNSVGLPFLLDQGRKDLCAKYYINNDL